MSDCKNVILVISNNITENIRKADVLGIELLSQNIMSQLRNFVEAVAVMIYSENHDLQSNMMMYPKQ